MGGRVWLAPVLARPHWIVADHRRAAGESPVHVLRGGLVIDGR
jgi:hypothetical protein